MFKLICGIFTEGELIIYANLQYLVYDELELLLSFVIFRN